VRSTIDEYIQGSASADEAASLRDFADKPLVVLTADIGHDAAWSADQNHLAKLSTNSVHRVIAGATHNDADRRRTRRRRHHASHPRRRLIGQEPKAAGQMIPSAADERLISEHTWNRSPDVPARFTEALRR
jgi:hypothetical protein